MIRDHLRSNVVGYIALFVAMSGTAAALDGSNTVFSDDIVNGQVKTNDISNSNGVRSADVRDDTLEDGGLAPADLAPNSVGSSELATDAVGNAEILGGAVGTNEIAALGVLGRNIGTDEVLSRHIANDAVNSNELATDSVDRLEISQDAVGAAEIATGGVGAAEVTDGSLGAIDVDSIVERQGGIGVIEDTTARDGNWSMDSETVECAANEDMLSVTIDWTDAGQDFGQAEKALGDVPEIERNGIDSARVVGTADVGGGSLDPATFVPIATCLAP
jgi:hypothetical protein